MNSTPDSTHSAPAEELITIARIARQHGVRGEVIADLLTDFPDRFEKMRSATVRLISGEIITLELQQKRFHKNRLLLKFAGLDTVEAVEKLREACLVVTRSQLVRLPADTWYEFDLIGCLVCDRNNTLIGTVTGVQKYGAAPLLEVSQDQREYLIPLTHQVCPVVDPANKRIVIDPPEGLLDL